MSNPVQPPELDSSVTLDAFLSAASAKQPIPGGGAVTALTGALASAMGEMVLNYSIQKKDLQQYHEHNTKALQELHNARRLFQQLMVEDQQAYLAFSQARKDQADPQTLQQRVQTCVQVPLTIATTALQVLKIAIRVAHTSNRWLLSDLAVCGELAMATLRCGIHNVRVNLPELPEPQQTEYERECQRLHLQAIDAVKQLFSHL